MYQCVADIKKKKSKIVCWIWIVRQNHWIEVIQKDPEVKKNPPDKVWIWVLSVTQCPSHRIIHFWEAMWNSVDIFLCNYSTRYLKHSGQLVPILWPDSYSHAFPIILLHSHADSTHHVIPICYYCSLVSCNFGSFGELWLLSSETSTTTITKKKKKWKRLMPRTHLVWLSWSPRMLSAQARKRRCSDESWMEAIFSECNGKCNLLWKGTHNPAHKGKLELRKSHRRQVILTPGHLM